ncbi:MAG: TonB-dependent receptor [Zoogloeaceae bacterium]|jgi:iron complex outermembrane receptor protein|nr:TonB-dependent receptor [Zoogloeaceae bacterium]
MRFLHCKAKPWGALAAALVTMFTFSPLHAGENTQEPHSHVHGNTDQTAASAVNEAVLETIVVTAPPGRDAWVSAAPGDEALATGRARSSDAASLLRAAPGVSLHGAGGVSSLPVIHGLADDRLRVQVDGMDLIASCPNHMNPALSYLDPANVEKLTVYAGIAPVSVGGDSIGGSIIAETRAPEFAQPGQGLLTKGEIGAFYRSNGDARGGNVAATVASDRFSLTYTGAAAQAENYKAGGDFRDFTETGRPGHTLARDEVGSTAYKTRNHTLDLALRGGNHRLELSLGHQDVPYQLYPNQRMDMLANEEKRINLRYFGEFDRGRLEARAYHEKVEHYMDFGKDKLLVYGSLPDLNVPGKHYLVIGMPMYTESVTDGLSLKGEIDLSERDLLRLGALWQSYRLDDEWPPSPDCGVGNCSGGMAPLTFWNIHDGERERKALFGEWETRWNPQWTSLLGLRVERVTTDTGDISGYNHATAGYVGSSVGTREDFNAMERRRSDTNWDLTAMAAYQVDKTLDMKFGFARKTRSPNLYERYGWSTNTMTLVMNNFVGDGNGYLGNPDLKPEVARTLSLTADWHSADGEYQLLATPYYTLVRDYIDARRDYPGATQANITASGEFVRLQYVNQEARLYGIDLSGKMPIGRTSFGKWGLQGLLNYVNGKNLDSGDNLYNIMPLNARLTLTHEWGGWRNALEVDGVRSKDKVSGARNEVKTSGYSLVNLRASYAWRKIRVDAGIENLLDRRYGLPTGGAYVGQGRTMGINAIPWGIAVPGAGRSFYAGVRYRF